MRIPSGDLAPVRKRRRRYPGYGRRRHTAWPAVLVALLVIGGVVGGAYLLQQREDDPTDTVATELPACPSPKPAAAAPPAQSAAAPVRLPAPGQVQLRLLNGTGRDGLARTVGNELARRGFRVAGMGNAPKPLAGATRVVFGPGARPAATLVSAHVLGAQLVAAPKAPPGSIDVTLGSSFARLRNGAEVTAFARALNKPAPAPKPKPAASPTCR